MEPKTISVTELRLSAAEILGQAGYVGQHFIVQRFGRPMVAIVGVEEYEKLMHSWRGRDEDPSPASRDLSLK